MSSLHTKYRPTKFKDVVGQGPVVRAFSEALEHSKSFLLVGPSGTGKTTLARIAASELKCHERDVLEIDAATYTGIDDVRTVTSTMQYRPLGGHVKCTIVDECHALSSAAWKAMLKSLEEPPEWMYWFLCTTELNKVPETVRTRCPRFELKAVDRDVLFDLIKGIAAAEKLRAASSEEVLELCAKEARGSPRQAIVNLEACAATSSRPEAAELLRSAVESPQAFDLAKLLMEGAPWIRVQRLLADMKDTNPESIRHVVRDYVTKVVLGAKSEKVAGRAMEVLDAFSQPFPQGDGITPVLMACGRVLLQ